MKKLLLFLLIVIFFSSCKQNSEPIELTLEQKLQKTVNDYVTKWNYLPALNVSVYAKEGELAFNYCTGLKSITTKEQNTINSLHYIYSITKSFISASIIKLEQENKLSFTDTLLDFFEESELNEIYINQDAIIEELLCHRSGIKDYTETPSMIYANPFSKSSEWEPITILSFLEIPCDDRGRFYYSSANYILLGIIIERITGECLNTYLDVNFFKPLNLTINLYPQDAVDLSAVCHPHCFPNTFMGLAGDGKSPIDITTILNNALDLLGKSSWAAGGVICDSSNVVNWGYNLLSQNGSTETFIRQRIIDSVNFDNEDDLVYGYGIRKIKYKNYDFIGSYGRCVGDENLMFYNQDKDVCICILSSSNMRNNKTPNIDDLMYAIFDCIE